MIVVASIVLVVIALYAVAYPFFRSSAKAGPRRNRVSVHLEVKSGVRGIQSELESDYRTGIINKDEYDELQRAYGPGEREGTDATAGRPRVEEYDIEKRVRELRQQKRVETQPSVGNARPVRAVGRQPAVGGVKKSSGCPKCGRPSKQGDRFCTACGASLTGGAR